MDDEMVDSKRSFHAGGNEPLLKLIVPVYMAGALIGKAGSVLSELKAKHGGNIRISAGKEYYPGTEERVVVLTGTNKQVLAMTCHINSKMSDPGRDDSMKQITIDERRSRKTKIVLTSLAAGLLIGKGGNTIKGIQTSTQAILSITDSREGPVLGERLLTVIGDLDARNHACEQIIEVIANDASNMGNTMLRYPPSGSGNTMTSPITSDNTMDSRVEMIEKAVLAKLGIPPGSYFGDNGNMGGGGGGMETRLPSDVVVKVDVPSPLVGGILGKHGAIVKEISVRSGGAHLTFAGSAGEGATRELKITGNMQQTYKAYNLVEERVIELEQQQQQ